MKLFSLKRRGLGVGLKLLFFCVLAFIVGMFMSVWWLLPIEQLQQRVLQQVSQETGVQLQGENAALVFPFGLSLDLTIRSEVPELNDLKINNLRLNPVWTSLVTGSPAARMKGSLAGGEFVSIITSDSDLSAELSDIDLVQVTRSDLPYRLQGALFAQADAEQLEGGGQRAQGDFQITVSQAVALGLDQIGLDAELPLGQLEIAGQFSNMRINLEQAIMTGGAMDVSGSGTIFVGATPAQTRLNLNVRLQPTEQTPAGLRDLLTLTGVRPGADGSYQVQIGGNLARPTMR